MFKYNEQLREHRNRVPSHMAMRVRSSSRADRGDNEMELHSHREAIEVSHSKSRPFACTVDGYGARFKEPRFWDNPLTNIMHIEIKTYRQDHNIFALCNSLLQNMAAV